MDELYTIIKILIAIIVASFIGQEREKSGKPVGRRTLSLVCIGSALATIIAVDYFPMDAAKVIAGIITGIGFLGAGAIIGESGSVKGLTTAATIWSVAIVGIGIGMGEILIVVVITLLIYLILIEGVIQDKIRRRKKGKK